MDPERAIANEKPRNVERAILEEKPIGGERAKWLKKPKGTERAKSFEKSISAKRAQNEKQPNNNKRKPTVERYPYQQSVSRNREDTQWVRACSCELGEGGAAMVVSPEPIAKINVPTLSYERSHMM